MSPEAQPPLLPENVQDYPRPPRVERVPQTLRVELGNHLVAETNEGFRVLETHHAPTYYFPRRHVLAGLRLAAGHSFCEWKGAASYFDVCMDSTIVEAGAWAYKSPNPTFVPIADHLAFYVGRMTACYVGDLRVLPQPGAFYGGWVTTNLSGQIKGGPGTLHW